MQHGTYNALIRNVRVERRRRIEIHTDGTLQIHWRLMVSPAIVVPICWAPFAIVFLNAPLSAGFPFICVSDAFVEPRSFIATDVSPIYGRVIIRDVVRNPILVEIGFDDNIFRLVGKPVEVDSIAVLAFDQKDA